MTAAPERHARGARPAFSSDPQIDKLMAMVMALAGEVSVLRERLDTFERMAEAKHIVLRAEIDRYVPDAAAADERARWRAGFLDRVLWIVQDELALARDEGGKA